jgi:hypothetical protein
MFANGASLDKRADVHATCCGARQTQRDALAQLIQCRMKPAASLRCNMLTAAGSVSYAPVLRLHHRGDALRIP